MMQDPTFEGWTPLNFYGQVVDDAGQPVAGATVELGWNTNTATGGGSAERQTTSDAQGLFSLTGEHGKILQVHVEKAGYYTVSDGHGGNFFFEYANPAEPDYHQPDEHHPVTFYLRRKGLSAMVQSKTLRTSLRLGQPQVRVNFLSGFFHPDGQLVLDLDKPDYRTVRGRFPWSVTLSIAQGGLIETDEQFPFLAPAYGYAPSVRIDMSDPAAHDYSTGATRTYYFFLQDSNTYGHVTVDTAGNLPSLNVSYVYNPEPGNRVLEPAPKP